MKEKGLPPIITPTTFRRGMCYMICILLCASCGQKKPLAMLRAEKIAGMCLDSAAAYTEKQDVERAMRFLKYAEGLIPDIGNDSLKFKIYQNIAQINGEKGSPNLALSYLNKALKHAKVSKNAHFIVDALLEKAHAYEEMNLTDSAWAAVELAQVYYPRIDSNRKSVIMRLIAEHELAEKQTNAAETHAYKAATLAQDPLETGNALGLLCRIYIMQGQEDKAKMLLGIMPSKGGRILEYNRLLMECGILERQGDYKGALETYKGLKELDDSMGSSVNRTEVVRMQAQYDRDVADREHTRMLLRITWAMALAVMATLGGWCWYRRRMNRIYTTYETQIDDIRTEMKMSLGAKDTTIEEMKELIDGKIKEISILQKKMQKAGKTSKTADFIDTIKLGTDVLYTIYTRRNISQYGRKEQKAVTEVMQMINAQLSAILSNEALALTPKETFYLIMEYYGISDTQKAIPFCCSEQAVRSTKSRLNKKLDIPTALQTDTPQV